MSPLSEAIRAVAIVFAAGAFLGFLVYAVRWARKGGKRAMALGSALLLLLGFGVVADPPQQRIEEARRAPGKKDNESGDPPK